MKEIKHRKLISAVLVIAFLLTLGSAGLAASGTTFTYYDQPLYVNGIRITELAIVKETDVYVPLGGNFLEASGLTLTVKDKDNILTYRTETATMQLLSKAYTLNGIKVEPQTAALRSFTDYMGYNFDGASVKYVNLEVLTRMGVQSAWDFETGTLQLTTNGASAYRNIYRVVDVAPNALKVQDTVTKQVRTVRLAGIVTSATPSVDLKEKTVNIEFSHQGNDSNGNAYAYVWRGTTLLNKQLVDQGKAKVIENCSAAKDRCYPF